MSTTNTKTKATKAEANQVDILADVVTDVLGDKGHQVPNLANMSTEEYASHLATMARAGFEQGDASLVVLALNGAAEAEARNQTGTVVTTIRHRDIMGQALVDLARLDRDTKVGGKAVGQTEAKASARKHGVSDKVIGDTVIGLAIRTTAVFFGQVDTLTSEALSLWEIQADGAPAAWTALDLLVWAEARANVNQGSNRGQRPATLAEAKAKAEAKAETEAKAKAEAEASRQATMVKVTEAPNTRIGTVVTLAKLAGLSTENLITIRDTIDQILATREAEARQAKADAEAKAKAIKAEAEAESIALRNQAKAEAEAAIAEAMAKVSTK